MAALNPPFTLLQAIVRCGLTQSDAEVFATEVYMNDFKTCRDITDDDLYDAFKTFSGLTQAQGQIRVLPGQKKKIKAFSYWVKDQYRLGLDPIDTEFPVNDTVDLIEKASTHKQFRNNAKALAEAARPEKFSKDHVWDDWANTFVNYLSVIPGRNGVPLQYVIRENEEADPTPNEDFLIDYIRNAPIVGKYFIKDANVVHIHLANLIASNDEASSILKLYETEKNGRTDWMALKNHYEGSGVYAARITEADHVFENLTYTGEKKPHMWWILFEQKLNAAFNAYVKFENKDYHSDSHKLRILMGKVKCDWMGDVKGSIKTRLQEKPCTYTYQQALQAFKTEVNNKFPPGSTPNHARRISEASGAQGRGYGNRGGRGRGYGGRSYGGRGSGNGRGGRGTHGYQRTDPKTITLSDGQEVEYHPSYNFPPQIYGKFTDEQRDMLKSQRRAYSGRGNNYGNNNNNDDRQIQEQMRQENDNYGNNRNNYGNNGDNSERQIQSMRQEIDTLKSIMSTGIPNSVAISQVSTESTMMGGRNEQANKRKRGDGP